MIDAYIYYRSTFLIDKLIICQYAREKSFLLYYLENVLTRFLFLLLDFLLRSLDLYS